VVALVESEGELERVAARFSAQTLTAHVTLGRYRGRVALPEYASVDLAVRLPSVGLYRSERCQPVPATLCWIRNWVRADRSELMSTLVTDSLRSAP
jgi:hypothetical protein